MAAMILFLMRFIKNGALFGNLGLKNAAKARNVHPIYTRRANLIFWIVVMPWWNRAAIMRFSGQCWKPGDRSNYPSVMKTAKFQ